MSSHAAKQWVSKGDKLVTMELDNRTYVVGRKIKVTTSYFMGLTGFYHLHEVVSV